MNKSTMNMKVLRKLCLIGAIVVGNIFLTSLTIQNYSIQNNLSANKLLLITLLIAVVSIALVIGIAVSIVRTIDIYKNPDKYPHLTQKTVDYQTDEKWAPPSNDKSADLFFTDDGDADGQLFRLDSKEREEYLRKRRSAAESVKNSKKKLYEEDSSLEDDEQRDDNDYLTPRKRDIDIEMYTNKKDFYRKKYDTKKPSSDTLPE